MPMEAPLHLYFCPRTVPFTVILVSFSVAVIKYPDNLREKVIWAHNSRLQSVIAWSEGGPSLRKLVILCPQSEQSNKSTHSHFHCSAHFLHSCNSGLGNGATLERVEGTDFPPQSRESPTDTSIGWNDPDNLSLSPLPRWY